MALFASRGLIQNTHHHFKKAPLALRTVTLTLICPVNKIIIGKLVGRISMTTPPPTTRVLHIESIAAGGDWATTTLKAY